MKKSAIFLIAFCFQFCSDRVETIEPNVHWSRTTVVYETPKFILPEMSFDVKVWFEYQIEIQSVHNPDVILQVIAKDAKHSIYTVLDTITMNSKFGNDSIQIETTKSEIKMTLKYEDNITHKKIFPESDSLLKHIQLFVVSAQDTFQIPQKKGYFVSAKRVDCVQKQEALKKN